MKPYKVLIEVRKKVEYHDWKRQVKNKELWEHEGKVIKDAAINSGAESQQAVLNGEHCRTR